MSYISEVVFASWARMLALADPNNKLVALGVAAAEAASLVP
jgi:hypothetical protein